jgi:hypothetical protein
VFHTVTPVNLARYSSKINQGFCYYPVALSALRHNFEFWKHGAVRCVLVAEKTPAGYVVQVISHDTAVVYERCETEEQAEALAGWFWKVFVDQ